MPRLYKTIALVAALSLSGAAHAQGAPDPVRLRLAHEVMEANGGVAATRERMSQLMSGIIQLTKQNLPAGQTGTADTLFKYIADEQQKAVPAMIEDAASVYADQLTETELRDMLAWANSPSGRSIREKMPQITQALLVRQGPRMKEMVAGMLTKAVDETCSETHCTPEERKTLAAVTDQVIGAAKGR
jgi:hypothetical protein